MKNKIAEISEGIFTIDNFFAGDVCRDMVNDLESSGLFPESLVPEKNDGSLEQNLESRNRHRILYKDEELAQDIWDGLMKDDTFIAVLPKAKKISDQFRFYKYFEGQEFLPHIDGPCKEDELESTHSLLIYLNEDFEGGMTAFDTCTISVSAGKVVFFPHTMIHWSTKITRGLKYIMRADIVAEK